MNHNNSVLNIPRREKLGAAKKKPKQTPFRKIGLMKTIIAAMITSSVVVLSTGEEKGDKLIVKYLDHNGKILAVRIFFYKGNYKTMEARYEVNPDYAHS